MNLHIKLKNFINYHRYLVHGKGKCFFCGLNRYVFYLKTRGHIIPRRYEEPECFRIKRLLEKEISKAIKKVNKYESPQSTS